MVLKVNCDASIRGNGFVGIGFVIRDSSSKVIRAGIDKVQGDLEVEIVEVMAVRMTFQFIKEFRCPKINVESDNKGIID